MGMVVAPPTDIFLDGIATALGKRSKALKHKLKSLRVERTAAGAGQEENSKSSASTGSRASRRRYGRGRAILS